jgi:hypothetical protein
MERANNSDRPGDPDAVVPVEVPPEEASGPEQPPAGTVMAPKPDADKEETPDTALDER